MHPPQHPTPGTDARRALLDGLRRIPTANLCDAMAQLGLGSGVVHGLNALSASQPRAVGFAVTITQAPRAQQSREANLTTHARIIDEQLQADDLLVIDAGARRDVCTGGALLARRAQLRGAAGFVINGCLRDVREIADMGFPVHLLGSSPVKSAPTLQTIAINQTVSFGGAQIVPGDIVVTDDTGIVTITLQAAPAVLARAQQIAAREAAAMALMEGGMSFAQAMQESTRATRAIPD